MRTPVTTQPSVRGSGTQPAKVVVVAVQVLPQALRPAHHRALPPPLLAPAVVPALQACPFGVRLKCIPVASRRFITVLYVRPSGGLKAKTHRHLTLACGSVNHAPAADLALAARPALRPQVRLAHHPAHQVRAAALPVVLTGVVTWPIPALGTPASTT